MYGTVASVAHILERERRKRVETPPRPASTPNNSPPLPTQWDWTSLSETDASLYASAWGNRISVGRYGAPVFDQHANGWCGSCYLVSILHMLQDRLNVQLGRELTRGRMVPFLEINVQTAIDTLRQESKPTWNACHGGDVLRTLHSIEEGKVKIRFLTSADGSREDAYRGFPLYSGPLQKDAEQHPHRNPIRLYNIRRLPNDVSLLKSTLFQHGPIVLVLRAESILDSKGRGVVDTEKAGPPNHALVCVGWKWVEVEEDLVESRRVECWICRNSWGDQGVGPSKMPDNVHCVRNGKNECGRFNRSILSDPHAEGFCYVPFDFPSLDSSPSPWCEAMPVSNSLTPLLKKT